MFCFLATQGYRDEKGKKADKLQRQIKTCECKNKLKGLFLSSFFVAVSELIKPAGFLLYCNLQCAHTNGDFFSILVVLTIPFQKAL